MKFYNTLTKKKEEFIPLEEGKVACQGLVRNIDFSILECGDSL